jgi:hypothetical protein
VFLVRYGLDLYILFRGNSVFKGLQSNCESRRLLDLISLVGGVESADQVSGIWGYYFRTTQLTVRQFFNFASPQCAALLVVNMFREVCRLPVPLYNSMRQSVLRSEKSLTYSRNFSSFVEFECSLP